MIEHYTPDGLLDELIPESNKLTPDNVLAWADYSSQIATGPLDITDTAQALFSNCVIEPSEIYKHWYPLAQKGLLDKTWLEEQWIDLIEDQADLAAQAANLFQYAAATGDASRRDDATHIANNIVQLMPGSNYFNRNYIVLDANMDIDQIDESTRPYMYIERLHKIYKSAVSVGFGDRVVQISEAIMNLARNIDYERADELTTDALIDFISTSVHITERDRFAFAESIYNNIIDGRVIAKSDIVKVSLVKLFAEKATNKALELHDLIEDSDYRSFAACSLLKPMYHLGRAFDDLIIDWEADNYLLNGTYLVDLFIELIEEGILVGDDNLLTNLINSSYADKRLDFLVAAALNKGVDQALIAVISARIKFLTDLDYDSDEYQWGVRALLSKKLNGVTTFK